MNYLNYLQYNIVELEELIRVDSCEIRNNMPHIFEILRNSIDSYIEANVYKVI